MKHFYDENRREWNTWRAYHCHHRHFFTQFDTGEVICTSGNFSKDHRHAFKDIGVVVFDQTDAHAPALFMPDGSPIKTSWFGDTQRTFLLDQTHNICFEIVNILYREKDQPAWVRKNVPKRLWGKCSIYWPSPEQLPFGPPSKIRRPRKLTPEEREHLNGFRTAIKVQENIGNCEPIKAPTYGKSFREPVLGEDLLKKQWSDLDDFTKGRIKEHGIIMPVEELVMPYFITKQPPEEHGDVE